MRMSPIVWYVVAVLVIGILLLAATKPDRAQLEELVDTVSMLAEDVDALQAQLGITEDAIGELHQQLKELNDRTVVMEKRAGEEDYSGVMK